MLAGVSVANGVMHMAGGVGLGETEVVEVAVELVCFLPCPCVRPA